MAWHGLGNAFRTHADNLMWSARDILKHTNDIISYQKVSLHAVEYGSLNS
jgi:hypothetical protein